MQNADASRILCWLQIYRHWDLNEALSSAQNKGKYPHSSASHFQMQYKMKYIIYIPFGRMKSVL